MKKRKHSGRASDALTSDAKIKPNPIVEFKTLVINACNDGVQKFLVQIK